MIDEPERSGSDGFEVREGHQSLGEGLRKEANSCLREVRGASGRSQSVLPSWNIEPVPVDSTMMASEDQEEENETEKGHISRGSRV